MHFALRSSAMDSSEEKYGKAQRRKNQRILAVFILLLLGVLTYMTMSPTVSEEFEEEIPSKFSFE